MLRGACKLYGHVKDSCIDLEQPIRTDTRILDFGCGWGRIARFFQKDIDLENISGVDVLPELAKACQETFNSGNFYAIQQTGALPFDSGKFDVVLANSVFSHLNSALNTHWLKEIERVLKPNGIAVLTIIDLEKYKSMAKSGSKWFNSLGIDCEETLKKLESGEFVWVSTNRTGELNGYGLAFIPVKWIDEYWTQSMMRFSIKYDYSQSIVTLQKNKVVPIPENTND